MVESQKGIIPGERFDDGQINLVLRQLGVVRGAQVDEAGLIDVLKKRPDLTALLDVQHPEPPAADSELYSLPNVEMTSHIAGSANDEARRMDDFQRWLKDELLKHVVDGDLLSAKA